MSVKANVCTDSSKADCYSLGVPKAKVELREADGDVVAGAETDDNCAATLAVDKSIPAGQIVALSDLLDGGQVTSEFKFPDGPSSIAMMGKLKAGTTS